jgi:hypothetical protein
MNYCANFDFKKFEKEIVFESSVLAWIRIRIEQKCWIRIRIKSIRIHKPGLKFNKMNRGRFYVPWLEFLDIRDMMHTVRPIIENRFLDYGYILRFSYIFFNITQKVGTGRGGGILWFILKILNLQPKIWGKRSVFQLYADHDPAF